MQLIDLWNLLYHANSKFDDTVYLAAISAVLLNALYHENSNFGETFSLAFINQWSYPGLSLELICHKCKSGYFSYIMAK